MKILALFLVTVITARALSVFGDGIGLNPGFANAEPVLISGAGVLTLLAPGTYTAASWSVSGTLQLATAGNYIIIASSGSIALNATSKVIGPSNSMGVARVTFVPAAGFLFAGLTEGAVSVAQGLPGLPSESPPLVNISTRTTLAAGQTLTSGFVVGGKVSRRVLIRAVGPTLATFGITNALATPTLTVVSGVSGQNNQTWTNAGWGPDSSLVGVFTSVGAFALPTGSRDAAILLTLLPGSYTVQIGGGAGEVLAEIYLVD